MCAKKSKSQKRIQAAFIDMLGRTTFDDMAVKDIVARADVSRSVFYMHYNSKYDLADQIEENLIGGFTAIMIRLRKSGAESHYRDMRKGKSAYYTQYFMYVQEHTAEFSALLPSKCTTGFRFRFINAIGRTRSETLRQWSQRYALHGRVTIPADYKAEVLSSIYVDLFTTWLNHGCDLPEEEMSRMLIELWWPLFGYVC